MSFRRRLACVIGFLVALACGGLGACSPRPAPSTPAARAPAPAPTTTTQPAPSTTQVIIDNVTGKSAVEAGKRARATIEDVNARRNEDIQEADKF